MKDKNGKEIEKGSVIDLHQTVNGENLFIILSLEPIEVVYGFDLSREYEYNVNELLYPCKYSGEVDFEVMGNIYNSINIHRKGYNLKNRLFEQCKESEPSMTKEEFEDVLGVVLDRYKKKLSIEEYEKRK